MHRSTVSLLVVFCTLTAVPAFADDPQPLFDVQRLTDRVVVFTERSPWECNHVVIIGADGLVLVDPGHTPLMGRLIREAVKRELGRDRFAYIIDTHGHWGHTWGNAAFQEAVAVGHERVVEAMRADANRERRADYFANQIRQIETRLGELDPESEEAAALRFQLAHFERIERGLEEDGLEVQPPSLTFSDRLNLDLGNLTLEMRYLGRGHSDSDIAILVPEERVLLIGCFFLEQGPLPVFGMQPQLEPDRWLESFDALLGEESPVEYVVLGQHSVWPRVRLAAMRDYIARLWSEVRQLDAEGIDFDTAVTRLAPPSELDFVLRDGASEEDLAQYQHDEAAFLWRQLKESAAGAVEAAIDRAGTAAGIALFEEMAASNDTGVYFDENEFNLLGYRLLGEGRIDDAIAVFELNVERYPDSWNVYDSLGEAYAARGDTERAIELYRRSVELNPNNTNGISAIERLESEPSETPATS